MRRHLPLQLALVAALTLVTAAAAAVDPFSRPFSRLANYDGDSGDPVTTMPVDAAALRRAAAVLPDDARWAVHIGGDPRGQLEHDVIGVARLYFLPAPLVHRPADADWLLSYTATPRVPPGVRALSSVRVGPGIYLIRLR